MQSILGFRSNVYSVLLLLCVIVVVFFAGGSRIFASKVSADAKAEMIEYVAKQYTGATIHEITCSDHDDDHNGYVRCEAVISQKREGSHKVEAECLAPVIIEHLRGCASVSAFLKKS